MNIERGVPYYPSTYFYNPFYQFPPPSAAAQQTLPFFNNNEKENGAAAAAKFCAACAEGMYCAVAASFVAFPSASHEQYPQNFIESSSDGINSGQSGSNESHLSNDSSIIQREIQKEIAAVNAAAIASAASSSQLTIPEHYHYEEFKDMFIKNEPSSSNDYNQYHQHPNHHQIAPKQRRERKPQQNKILQNLDENGIRKRYSRFRSKNHVCDFCNKSFTLKQNVQTHMTLYHMTSQRVHRPLAAAKSKRELTSH